MSGDAAEASSTVSVATVEDAPEKVAETAPEAEVAEVAEAKAEPAPAPPVVVDAKPQELAWAATASLQQGGFAAATAHVERVNPDGSALLVISGDDAQAARSAASFLLGHTNRTAGRAARFLTAGPAASAEGPATAVLYVSAPEA